MIRQYLEAHGDRPRPDEARAPAAMMMAAAGAALRS
jgi:hypothetical protein